MNFIKIINFSFQRTSRDTSANFKSVHNDRPPDETTVPQPFSLVPPNIRIIGLRLESSETPATYTEDGVPELMSSKKATFRLFGFGFSERTVITFTEEVGVYRGSCQLPSSGQFRVIKDSVEPDTVLVETVMPKGSTDFYFCTKEAELSGGHVSVSKTRMKCNWMNIGKLFSFTVSKRYKSVYASRIGTVAANT